MRTRNQFIYKELLQKITFLEKYVNARLITQKNIFFVRLNKDKFLTPKYGTIQL